MSTLSSSLGALSSRTKRQSLSTIESSVTRLLVSTKHLLESLTQWARHEADDKFVSDAYVKLGNDFRAATRAFSASSVDISDIGDVPQALRIILEAALSEAPSQENLDRFLPNIRNIIVTLLQNLKAKQARARSLAIEKQLRQIDAQATPSLRVSLESARNSLRSSPEPATTNISDLKTSGKEDPKTLELAPEKASERVSERVSEKPPVSINIPKIRNGTSVTDNSPPTQQHRSSPTRVRSSNLQVSGQNDALSQLQKGNSMQRRASKRFSAYQYAKLTNFTPSSGVVPRISTMDQSNTSTPNTSFESKEVQGTTKAVPVEENGNTFIYLKLFDKTKKAKVPFPVTFASLRLLFVEKFAYSPGTSSFPDIYMCDPQTTVSYELEEHMLDEVKVGSLLSLHAPEVAKAPSTKSLEEKILALSAKVDSQNSSLLTEVRDLIKSIEIPTPFTTPPPTSIPSKKTVSDSQLKKLTSIRNELDAIKRLQSNNKTTVKLSVEEVMTKVEQLREVGVSISTSSNRDYMNKSNLKLSEDSDILLTKVDDLQDVMEALRKDVAQRGVRVGDKLLKHTQKEIEEAKTLLRELTGYIQTGKPVWKKIWESELDKVCEEQQFFNLQDDLTQDLEEDIKKIEETYELIEKCSLEQSKQGAYNRNKVVAKLYIPEPGESLHSLKDAVLNEVAAMIPDHDSRLEAIAKAEKVRIKERELTKLNKFQEELGDFVEDNKFKSSGRFEEIERIRKERDSENLKSSFGII